MLILTRRIGETLTAQDSHGNIVNITVIGTKGNQVRLGIDAPKTVTVHREEIWQRIEKEREQMLKRLNIFEISAVSTNGNHFELAIAAVTENDAIAHFETVMHSTAWAEPPACTAMIWTPELMRFIDTSGNGPDAATLRALQSAIASGATAPFAIKLDALETAA